MINTMLIVFCCITTCLCQNSSGTMRNSTPLAIMSPDMAPDIEQDLPVNSDPCDLVSCYNGGECISESTPNEMNSSYTCTCPRFFKGYHCEVLDMTIPNFEIGMQFIKFTWPREINLDNFYGLYIRTPKFVWFWEDTQSVLWVENHLDDLYSVRLVQHRDQMNSVELRNLEGGAASFALCLVFENRLPNMTDPFEVQKAMFLNNSNCGSVVMSYKGGVYGKAAKYIAIGMGMSVVILFICRAVANCRDNEHRELVRKDIKRSLRVLKTRSGSSMKRSEKQRNNNTS